MDEIVKDTVQWCNKIRKEKGLDPIEDLPKGERSNMSECPCGKATGVEVGNFYFYVGKDINTKSYPLPEAVTRFVRLFDSGKYPEYSSDNEPEGFFGP